MTDPKQTQLETDASDSLSIVDIVMLAAVFIALAIPMLMILAAL